MRISTHSMKGIGAASLAFSLALGLGSSMASTKKQVMAAPEKPAFEANSVLNELVQSGDFNRLSTEEIMKRFEAQGLFSGQDGNEVRLSVLAEIKARRVEVLRGTQLEGRVDLESGIGRTPQNPIRVRPLHSRVDIAPQPWVYENEANQARSGFYPLPFSDTITTYSYENDFVFRTLPSLPGSDMADVITFGGQCPTPPEGIVSIEYLFNVGALAPNGVRRRALIWNTWNPAAAPATSVFSNNLATFNDDFGQLPVGLFYLEFLTVATPIFPTHADNIGIEFKFRDNVTDAFISTQTWFAVGPAIGPFDAGPGATPSGSGPPTGTSANFFYRDQNLDGVLATNEALLFATTPQPGNRNWANLNIHIGGRPPSTEVEPNNTAGTGNPLCLCDERDATRRGAGGDDHYKLTVTATTTVQVGVVDCAAGSVTLTLRDAGATVIGGPVAGCPGFISLQLAPGMYDAEVLGAGTYTMSTKPLAALVTGMKFTTAPNKDVIVWDSQPNSLYDVVRGNILMMQATGGAFDNPAVTTDCWDVNLSNPTTTDPTTPTGPADSLWYLSRAKNVCSGVGSYNEGGNQEDDRDDEIGDGDIGSCP